MSTNGSASSHSSQVALWLHQGECRLSLAQVGAGRLYFESAVTLASGLAELERIVDGHVRRWAIRVLADSKPDTMFRFEFCDR